MRVTQLCFADFVRRGSRFMSAERVVPECSR